MTAVELARSAGREKYSPSDLSLLEDIALEPAPELQGTVRQIRDRFEATGIAIEKAHNGAKIMATVNARLAVDDATGNGIGRVVIPFLVVLGSAIAAAVLIRWEGDRDEIIRFGGVVLGISAILAVLGLVVGIRDRQGPSTGWTIGAALVSAVALLRTVILEQVAPLESGPVWFITVIVSVSLIVIYALVSTTRNTVARRARRRDLEPVLAQATTYLETLRHAFDDSVRDAVRATSAMSEKELSAIKADRDRAFNVLTERDLVGAELPTSIHAAALGEVQLRMVLIPLLGGSSAFVKL